MGSEQLTIKQNQRPSPGDEAGTAKAAPGRVGQCKQGEARRANNTPNCGPHLELGRVRLKAWSTSDFPIAQMTSLYTCTCVYCTSDPAIPLPVGFTSSEKKKKKLFSDTVVPRIIREFRGRVGTQVSKTQVKLENKAGTRLFYS